MATRFDSILAVTDFSRPGNEAVHRAALLALQHEARLTLLHVVDPARVRPLRNWLSAPVDLEHRVAQAQVMLGRLAREIVRAHDVHVSVAAPVGDAFDQIGLMAGEADLLVIGQKSRNILRDFVLGTPAERLVRMLGRPVLVVKRASDRPYRRVLVPVDFSASSPALLHSAVGLAPAASVHLFHALSVPWETKMHTAGVSAAIIERYRHNAREQVLRDLRRMIATAQGADVSVAVAPGHAARLTLERQQRIEADLIVIGKDGQSTMGDFLLGSVAQRLLADAVCDVLVIPKAALRVRADRDAVIAKRASARIPDWAAPT